MISHQNLKGKCIKNYEINRILGEGANGIVYQAFKQNQNVQQIYAIKVIPRQSLQERLIKKRLLQDQIRIMLSCNNENVIKCIEYFASKRSIFLVLEYCDGGDLQKRLKKQKRLPENEALKILKQIINGFKGLHQVNAMHRDFKLANILEHNGKIKIADLGFAKITEENVLNNTILGTLYTKAPEVIDSKPYNWKADIWSIGIVTYQLLYGKRPFYGINDYTMRHQIRRMTKQGLKFPQDPKISIRMKDFIRCCLIQNPENRISWPQIYQHQIFQQFQSCIKLNLDQLNLDLSGFSKFYQKEQVLPVKTALEAIERQNERNFQQVQRQEQQINESLNMTKIVEKFHRQKQIQKSLQLLKKNYTNERNSKMFIFKFILPELQAQQDLKNKHSVYLFLLCKKTLLDILGLLQKLKQKQGLNQDISWHNFKKSKYYTQLISLLKSDICYIEQTIICLINHISGKNQIIQRQISNLRQTNQRQFQCLMKQEMILYKCLLTEELIDQRAQSKRQKITRILLAVQAYFNHDGPNYKVKNFQYQLRDICYEKKIQAIIQKNFKYYTD